ncbi:MAG TPA: hypothetical protein DCQ26_10250 [Marinilabiliales bacterium]|nr:MAG: hypothetical protein A2W95_13945 [Bacteroidetes bacterium GWA2_40_14]OFX73279.1 MAG: hypothetical protein A2W96_07405 [Bacteroidetes bacterium GWD2_40_43]OFX92134.1 MAG: hypothetical protein A2W97_08695 [Bacteroidetes bacterium GWE2_40_63]OFY24296.1 MAG: hypothetical protein A2W88_07515 [Bacteroidetes bacterium GWF2_40_13]OFZ28923.1 MAG: hypothetical protein A2437_02655 [Bacteroidetes bacterium RIFOXYC2_FULL_40_12]HAM98978.1 hypothetical protein [Marinilabiliales bacterium]
MPKKIMLLGDSATQLIKKALLSQNITTPFLLEVFEADYNQIERQILDSNSELYRYKPDIILVFQCTQQLLYKFEKTELHSRCDFANDYAKNINHLLQTINSRIRCNVLWNNFYEMDDGIFGNFANKTKDSFLYQLRTLNLKMSELSQQLKNLFIYDLSSIQNQMGAQMFVDHRLYYLSKMALSIDGMQAMIAEVIRVIKALNGYFNKCVILDLDNTLWGGVIGDEGVENIQLGNLGIGKTFSDLQLWAKELKNRGILLAICSKNALSVAQEPFLNHPDMILSLDDFAVFVANWNNKVDNIRYIQQVLNIGFDSMVFIDDNPFERNMVLEAIPEITVPELPEDATEYLAFLQRGKFFETASVSEADASRTQQYQTEAKRIELKSTFTNENEYLQSLNMVCQVLDATPFLIPRIAQLTQRSNQFNLRTQRYTDNQLETMLASGNYVFMSFLLADKFGDYGLVSAIILEKRNTTLFIDTWIMSCRVLKRDLELFVLNKIVNFAIEKGFSEIAGEYLPTSKNQLVKQHFADLGFSQKDHLWTMLVANFVEKPTFIKEK